MWSMWSWFPRFVGVFTDIKFRQNIMNIIESYSHKTNVCVLSILLVEHMCKFFSNYSFQFCLLSSNDWSQSRGHKIHWNVFEEDDDAVDVFLRQPPWSRFLCPLKSGDFFLAPEQGREKWLWWLWRRKMLLIMGKTIVVNKIDSPP